MKRPEYLLSETMDVYNASRKQFITSSKMWTYVNSPIMCGIERTESTAMYMGTAIHKYILEGSSEFNKEYIVGGPINPKTGEVYGRATKAFAEWMEQNPGKGVVSADELDSIKAMDRSVKVHPLIAPLLNSGWPEGVVRAEYYGAPCQIRIDWLTTGGTICDLKTCEDITEFKWNIRKYGYGVKASFYQQILRVAAGDFIEPDYRLIVVEKNPPYRSGLWMFPDEALQAIHLGARSDIAGIMECSKSGKWPSGYEELQIAEIE